MSAPQLHRKTFASSELSRNTARVFREAEEAPVDLTRRDGEAMRLMTAAEDDRRTRLLRLAAQIIAVTTKTDGTLAERMGYGFPWMAALPEQARVSCAEELVESARASFATDQPHRLEKTVEEWCETARALAAGLTPESDRDDEELDEPVELSL